MYELRAQVSGRFGLFGRDKGARSIVPVLAWVVAWLVLPCAGGVAGNSWAFLDLWRTLAFAVCDAGTHVALDRTGSRDRGAGMIELLYAHRGGWDEILMFAVLVLLAFAGLRWAERRARRNAEEHIATTGDDPGDTPPGP